MPRQQRLVLPGIAHHVTQRGNNRQQVFFSDQDRQSYVDRLFRYASEYSLRILAYCLMPNHVHVVAIPLNPITMARVFGRLLSDYARYANVSRGASGHLWQERYYSHPMDDNHTLRAMAYVERNPLRAGLVPRAGDYRWSSAAAHLQGFEAEGRLDFHPWNTWYTRERWAEVLAVGLDEEGWRERFREASRRGLPMGATDWVRQIECATGRDLSFRPPGRPRLSTANGDDVCIAT